MAENLGLDFGTTYSILSEYKNGELRGCQLGDSIKQINPINDSIVIIDNKGKYRFGQNARKLLGNSGTQVFKGFKMLMSEKEGSELLSKRGYSKEHSPEQITDKYLSYIINEYLRTNNTKNIGHLCIGVPEIWFSKNSTIDCRTKLQDIVRNIKNETGNTAVNTIQLISEPAAACAYYLYLYEKHNAKKFSGHALIVDFGGGTLDLALCHVENNENGNKVSVLKRDGFGTNENGEVGKAGMCYIESIVNTAIGKEVERDSSYFKAVNDFEDSFINLSRDDIEEFKDFIESQAFTEAFPCSVHYNGEEYKVTYGDLYDIYDAVIKKDLVNKINSVKNWMKDNGIDYSANNKNFKIVLVGGFSNYYLTERVIVNDIFNINLHDDNRYDDIIKSRFDRENSISYGLTLIANDIIGFEQRSPYSLGIAREGIAEVLYSIKQGSKTNGQPQWIKNKDGEFTVFASRGIPRIAFRFDDNPPATAEMTDEIKKKLNISSIEDRYGDFIIGFSLDDSQIISLHVWQLRNANSFRGNTLISESNIKQKAVVELDNLEGLFGGIIVKEAL